ncbi:MAG: YihY/virulence factor BrkB family protein [Actinomycetota bacterium]
MSTATAVPETYTLEGDDALEALRRAGWGRLLKDAFHRFRAADGFSHSRALAYQFTLTALPGLIAIVGLATALDQETFRRILRETLQGLAPGPAGSVLTRAFEQGSEAGGGSGTSALVIGLLVAVVSGTIAMGTVERGANRIYGVKKDRGSIAKYATALLLASSSGLLMLAAFVLLVAGRAIEDAVRVTGSWSDTILTLWDFARWPAGVVFVVVAFALLFKRSPRRIQPAASWLTVGSALAVILFSAFTALLTLYLNVSKSFGQTYGPLAGMIGILLWAHLTSLALFLGLAFAAQLEAVRAGVPAPQE